MEAKKTVKNIEAYAVPLFDEEGYLKLNSNESDFGPSPKVIESLKKLSASDLQFYPFYGKLLEKLAAFHNVKVENIILTAGADEGISSILGTFLDVGQTVLTVNPTFVMPKIFSKIKGLNFLEIPYEKKWEFPIDTFLKNIKNANLIHLTTPNSPTGEVLNRDNIKKIIELAKNKAILIDETYANYSGETNTELVKTNENVFITRSFSKDFALAGLRLGYVISAEENIKELRKYLSPYNVSTLTVKAGIAAIDDFNFFETVKQELEASRIMLTQGLEKLGAKVYPSKTNFICVDFGTKADFIYKKLLNNKIKVKYYKQTPMLENCLRIGIPRIKNTEKILDVLKIKPTIVFDMDGVLIDASKSYRIAVEKTFETFAGKKILPEEISATKKLGGLNNDWDLTEFLLKQNGFNIDKNKIIDVFQRFYEKLAETESPLIDKAFFEELSKDYNLAIFTGRVKEEAYYTLGKHGFTEYFFPIITMLEVGLDHQKPDSLGLEMIKEKIITDKIYYLGDTVDDMMSAQGANVNAIGVLPPQDKSEDLTNLLKSKNAMVVLNQATDLINFLKGLQCAQV